MENIKSIIIIVSILLSIPAIGQTNKSFIKGAVDIRYNTRIELDKKDITDNYTLDINISDNLLFRGNITHLPTKIGMVEMFSQVGKLTYNIDCHAVNPGNLSDTRSIGRITGIVPIDIRGAYQFGDGTLQMAGYTVGRSQAFESKFGGTVLGKPIKTSVSIIDKIKKDAVKITKQAQGKTISLVVTNYDKMVFQNHILAIGPVQNYPETKVNGEMVYDYERLAWYFHNLSISYAVDGKAVIDRLSGNIRWIESPKRKINGEGEYQFDIRLNEDSKNNEASVFSVVSDESAFFQTDESISSLVGSLKYKDGFSKDVVITSSVVIDLRGNKLSKQQMVNLYKIVFLSSIIPINAE